MTKQTEGLIRDFVLRDDWTLFSSIIIAIQNDDNVSDAVGFKNPIRVLRNISAHESVLLSNALKHELNKFSAEFMVPNVQTANGERRNILIAWVDVIASLLKMSLIKDSDWYRVFAQSICERLYGRNIVKYNFLGIDNSLDFIDKVIQIDLNSARTGVIRKVHIGNEWLMNALGQESLTLPMRVIFPDMIQLFRDAIDTKVNGNFKPIEFALEVYMHRESKQ